ncbi:MAG: hypothetical protein Q4D38_08045 [Planctomycetia bacterium]|nr:hypothetical protein [Planctomycetia bacterium]
MDNLWTPEEDVLLILDKKETIYWRRPQSDLSLEIPNAMRISDIQTIRDSSPAHESESVWIIPKPSFQGELPFLGDTFRDAEDDVWVVSKLQRLKNAGCWKCTAMNVRLQFRLNEKADWYRPQWTLDAEGAPFPEYRLLFPGIMLRIENASKSNVFHLLMMGGTPRVVYRDCFVTPDNRGFRALEFYPADSWRDLSRVVAEEIEYGT